MLGSVGKWFSCYFPVTAIKFPVPSSREFEQKSLLNQLFMLGLAALNRGKSQQFPVFSLPNREFGANGFAPDSLHHRLVQSLEIGCPVFVRGARPRAVQIWAAVASAPFRFRFAVALFSELVVPEGPDSPQACPGQRANPRISLGLRFVRARGRLSAADPRSSVVSTCRSGGRARRPRPRPRKPPPPSASR
jgi:hypothetical protein